MSRTLLTCALALAPGLAASFVQAQGIATLSEYEAASKKCADDWVCIHNVSKDAYPPSDEIAGNTGPWFFIGMQYAAAKAAIQVGPDAGIAILDETIAMVDPFYGGTPHARYFTAVSHLYRAEACLDAGQSECFFDSAGFLLEREIAMRALPGEPVSTDGVRWSEIRDKWFDKHAHGYFEDEWAPAMKDDPRGTDFRARIDRVLTIAEKRAE